MKKQWLSIMTIVCVLTTSIQFPGFAVTKGNSNYEKVDVATSSDVKQEQENELDKIEEVENQYNQDFEKKLISAIQDDVKEFEIDEYGVLVKYKGDGGDVVIPNGVTGIGDFVFSYCSSLTSIGIPEGVTSIGDGAFMWCGSLTSIEIPKRGNKYRRLCI